MTEMFMRLAAGPQVYSAFLKRDQNILLPGDFSIHPETRNHHYICVYVATVAMTDLETQSVFFIHLIKHLLSTFKVNLQAFFSQFPGAVCVQTENVYTTVFFLASLD